MKWSIVILIVLGLLAALSAAILVGVLRAAPSDSATESLSSDVEIVLAKTSLPGMSVITPKHITTSMVSKNDPPEGYISNPVLVIGRVLATSVVEGQVLTKSCFVAEGSAAQLIAAIPHGMRAISVMLSNHAVTGGLLYPGSVVDVLASFRLRSRDSSKGQAISTTLLQGIQVLAVDDVSVVSKKTDDEKNYVHKENYSSNRKLTVTLMVTSKQAEALQLAREYGSIFIAIRNPLDRYPVESDTTVLSEGLLAKFGSVLTPAVLTPQQKKDLLEEMRNSTKEVEKDGKEAKTDFVAERQQTDSSHQWGVTVIRGRDVQIHQLDIPKRSITSLVDIRK